MSRPLKRTFSISDSSGKPGEAQKQRTQADKRSFPEAVAESLGGKPSRRLIKSARVHTLKKLCHDFDLLPNPERKLLKADYLSFVLSTMEEVDPNFKGPQEFTSKYVRIRLFANEKAHFSQCIAEMDSPRLPCGGLSLAVVSTLLDGLALNFTRYKVLDDKRFKPINLEGDVIPRDVVNMLLVNSTYIRVVGHSV